jgi:hypothetical protein
VDKLDDEGRLELPSEEQMYLVLGLKKEDEIEEQEREGRRCGVDSLSARKGCEEAAVKHRCCKYHQPIESLLHTLDVTTNPTATDALKGGQTCHF